MRLAEVDGSIEASLEPMVERSPEAGIHVLAGALDLATAGLEPACAQAAAALARIVESPVLARAKGEATGELRYYVDELDTRLVALAQTFGKRTRHDDDDEPGARRRRPTVPPPGRDQSSRPPRRLLPAPGRFVDGRFVGRAVRHAGRGAAMRPGCPAR